MKTNNVKSVEVKLLPKKSEEIHIKAYKRRWYILLVYMYYSSFAYMEWIEYSSITNIVVKYYNVSTLTVDWSSIVFMIAVSSLTIPASLVMEKQGLRTIGLIGCIATFLGTALKVLSIKHDLFWIVLLGQAIVSIGMVFIVVLPPKIASVWFKSSEISTACALGVLGGTGGIAVGYILPTMVVHDSANMDDIAAGLSRLCWILAVLMTPVTIAVIFYFPKKPPLPPSATEYKRGLQGEKFDTIDFFCSLKKMIQNKGFLIHLLAYSLNLGVSTSASTLLSQIILHYFEGANEEAGKMGFLSILTGLVAIFLFGVIMDKTRKYKELALISYLLFGISFVFLMISLQYRSMTLTYISCGLIGFSSSGYIPVGFELAVELTFPAPVLSATGIVMAGSQIVSAILTMVLGRLNLWLGPFWSLSVQAAILFFGTIITALIPNRMLRQEASKNENNDV